MKKRGLLLSTLFLLLIFILPITFAAQVDVTKSYSCLEDKISDKTCSKLSLSEKIFSVLATGECKGELRADASNEGCWPETNCNIKTTAQAFLALKSSDAKEWLLDQEKTPSEITWFLQIDTLGESDCNISYNSRTYDIEIGEDKKIDSAAGSCLSLSASEYWLEISSTCYDEEFEISCDERFITNLLFRSDASSTIHVSGKTSSSSGEGTTTEEVNSFCFTKGSTCDYEGTLWAALALSSVGYDISPYLPYLITMVDENKAIFPQPILYALTGYEDFKLDIVSKQTSNGYWQITGNKYYDTALALYPFTNTEFDAKQEAKDWLANEQDANGCWNSGNILDTAFILHSIWPKDFGGGSCTSAGYYCMSAGACDDAGGEILPDYECSSYSVCCSAQPIEKTCDDAGGQICTGGTECTGDTLEAADTFYCCFDECEVPEPASSCESHNGVCEPGECGTGYEISYAYECESYGDICCIEKPGKGPNALFWILIILIILVVLGIIFRNRLKEFWFRIKPGSKKFKPRGPLPGPGLPPIPSTDFRPRTAPRRIMPAMHRPAPRAPKKPERTHGELEEVLKKLKDMGNR